MARYHMYLGTYTNKGGVGIEHYAFDAETGDFALLDKTAAPCPSYLALSPDGRFMYAALETSLYGKNGGIGAYAVAEDGSLTEIDRADVGGVAPCHVSVHPSGKTLYAANYMSGSLTVFELKEDGTLGARTLYQHEGGSVNETRQEGPHAHNAVVMSKGRKLSVVDLGLDGVMQYPLDENGAVSGAPVKVNTPAGSGPRHIVFAKDGKHAYVVCELGNRILTYSIRCGRMKLVDDQSTLPADFTGRSACAAVRLSEDGRFLYLTNRFHDTLAQYAVDKDGMLTLVGLTPTGGKNPRDCTLAPEGRFALCAHQDSDEVTVLALDETTGVPALKPVSIACSMPVAVLFGGKMD